MEIGFADATATRRAEAALGSVDGLAPERDGDVVRLSTDDGARALMDVLRSLDAHGLAPTKLSLREPSLDDVFLAITGHRAEPTDRAEDRALPARGAA